ncbi:hypothetical protein B0T14DRAFT_265263 [Immersiella caudata]|uniref:Uncharacterized protein n=1 Tax=Immersiella caudata TaxID=314043 RepID=A0AA39WL25_9PEZI|nr:hypothetical protein B0T14DRAFT_265263 [Immersiella caudata]
MDANLGSHWGDKGNSWRGPLGLPLHTGSTGRDRAGRRLKAAHALRQAYRKRTSLRARRHSQRPSRVAGRGGRLAANRVHFITSHVCQLVGWGYPFSTGGCRFPLFVAPLLSFPSSPEPSSNTQKKEACFDPGGSGPPWLIPRTRHGKPGLSSTREPVPRRLGANDADKPVLSYPRFDHHIDPPIRAQLQDRLIYGPAYR